MKKKYKFPNPEITSEEGIIAIGGDLSPYRLISAYKQGIFPWYKENEEILWWSPKERFILNPKKIHISKSMKKIINKKLFKISFDKDFYKVIKNCGKSRESEGTWITKEMLKGYQSLHNLGYCHSVECWQEEKLVGGLYGVSLGKCFFGESMFSKVSNASKYALIHLCKKLEKLNFKFIDCQIYSKHLESLGAKTINRKLFLELLNKALKYKNIKGNWGEILK